MQEVIKFYRTAPFPMTLSESFTHCKPFQMQSVLHMEIAMLHLQPTVTKIKYVT